MISVPLQTWASANAPRQDMRFESGYWSQILLVRDELPKYLVNNFEDYQTLSRDIKVIGTHSSKSIELPVMEITLPGMKFLLRNNFHGWLISVESENPLLVDFKNLFPDVKIPPIYCGGFPEDRIHDTYNKCHTNFTVELQDEYEVVIFFWLIGTSLGLGRKQ